MAAKTLDRLLEQLREDPNKEQLLSEIEGEKLASYKRITSDIYQSKCYSPSTVMMTGYRYGSLIQIINLLQDSRTILFVSTYA